MADNDGKSLHPMAQEIADDFELRGGRIVMPDPRIHEWTAKMVDVPSGQRKDLATNLVVLAQRILKQAGEAAEEAVFLLALLATELLGSAEKASDLFGAAGVDVKKQSELLGKQGPDYKKMQEAPPAGALSMLGFLGDRKKKSD